MGTFISAIILAAGQGMRMGRQKLLLPLDGRTILERATDAVLGSKVDGVIAVLGYQADETAAVLEGRPVRLVYNPGYPAGLSTSLIAGIKAADRRAGAFLVVLADQPYLTPPLIDQLVDFFNSNHYLIVRPVFENRPGHPVLMDSYLLPELLDLKGDTGAREVLARYDERVGLVHVEDQAVLQDVDTPVDYLVLKLDL